MRGKQHMKSYKKLAGGWGNPGGNASSVPADECKLINMYGGDALTFYNWSRVAALDDQKKWIEKHDYLLHLFPKSDRAEWAELRQRVLDNDYPAAVTLEEESVGELAEQPA